MKNFKNDIDGIFDGIQDDENIPLPDSARRTIANLPPKKTKGGAAPKQSMRMRWTAAVLAVMLIVPLTIVLAVGGGIGAANVLSPVSLSRSDIIGQIKQFGQGNRGDGPGAVDRDDALAAAPDSDAKGDFGNAGNDYAKTNVQHEGIDEGDIIKVDGGYIYKLSDAGLVIVSVAGGMKISCKIDYENFVPAELFILGDKLIVIGGVYEYYPYNYGGVTADIAVDVDACIDYWGWIRYNCTRVMVYDLKDRVNLQLLEQYDVEGGFMTSRLIDNKLILTVNYYYNFGDEDTYIPKINSNEIDVSKISIYETQRYWCYYILCSINLNSLKLDYSAHLGLYGMNYFSRDNVYFFCTDYDYVESELKYDGNGILTDYFYSAFAYTTIVKVNLNSLKYAASNKIEGYVADRYYADEHKNNLRVVSLHNYYSYSYTNGKFAWEDDRHTNVYVLDGRLNVIGNIKKIAPGENIYSVRFHGDTGSIVTFLQTDPLFKLNLSNPRNPRISQGYEEDGVNTYLQYLSKDVLLGLGLNGDGGRLSGMKIALYDNSGADATLIKHIDIAVGCYAYSEALYNPKAILNDTARNMFSFPMQSWEYGVDYKRDKLTQGLAVFEYNLKAENDNDKLLYKGVLSNIDDIKFDSWYDRYDAYRAYITRGARIGDRIYTISDKYVTSYNAETLAFIEKLQIAEFKSAAELFG